MDSLREGRREREKGAEGSEGVRSYNSGNWIKESNCYYMTNWREGGRKRERGAEGSQGAGEKL